jgi:uncharacterized protein (DUF1330 family)
MSSLAINFNFASQISRADGPAIKKGNTGASDDERKTATSDLTPSLSTSPVCNSGRSLLPAIRRCRRTYHGKPQPNHDRKSQSKITEKDIPMPAYMISQVTVTDKPKFESYLAKTRTLATKFGAKPIAIGAKPKMLNGESDGHQMVFVIEFETIEKLDAWHNSDDYQALVSLREEGSNQRMVAYEAMDMAPS